jgi:hypothetical protein
LHCTDVYLIDVIVAVPARLELATFGLGNRCSIRLSYGTALKSFVFLVGVRFFAPILLRQRIKQEAGGRQAIGEP